MPSTTRHWIQASIFNRDRCTHACTYFTDKPTLGGYMLHRNVREALTRKQIWKDITLELLSCRLELFFCKRDQPIRCPEYDKLIKSINRQHVNTPFGPMYSKIGRHDTFINYIDKYLNPRTFTKVSYRVTIFHCTGLKYICACPRTITLFGNFKQLHMKKNI